jgi:hypothetical protein
MQDDLGQRVAVEIGAMRLTNRNSKDIARAIIPLVLERAATLLERGDVLTGPNAVAHAIQAAAAIRAIGAKP